MQFFWDTFYSVRVRLVGPTRTYLSDFLHVCRDDLGPNLQLHSPLLKIKILLVMSILTALGSQFDFWI